jgi:hypothetical protein
MIDAELDRLVVRALGVDDVDARSYASASARTHALITALAEDARQGRRAVRTPRRTPVRRVVIAMVALLLLMAAAVAANPDLRSRILGSTEPAAKRMHAFRGAQRHDAIPPQARRMFRTGVAPENGAGPTAADAQPTDLDDVRLLLDDSSRGLRVGMWGTRTTRGRACYFLLAGPAGTSFPETGGVGTCIEFRPGWPLAESYGNVTADRWGVYGGMADGVVDVRMRMPDGSTSPALIGSNVFAWVEGPDGALPVAIEAELVDGSTVVHAEDIAAGRR